MTEKDVLDYKEVVVKNYEKIFNIQDFVCERFNEAKHIEYIMPHGCNMIFFCRKGKKSSIDFKEMGLGLYPGDYFNMPNSTDKFWSRICMTISKNQIEKGLKMLGV